MIICAMIVCKPYVAVTSASIHDPDNPSVLIEGVLFRARYLGSTQLISEGQPSKAMRMMQAQEAVGRIKVSQSQDIQGGGGEGGMVNAVLNQFLSCRFLHCKDD